MNAKLEGRATAILTMGCLVLGGWLMGQNIGQNRPSVQVFQAENGLQVVLEVVSTTDGKFWVRPKSQIFFRLTPKDPSEHYAPLPAHSLMICHEFNFRGSVQEMHAGFVCGTEAYALEAFGFTKEVQSDAPEPGSRRRNMGEPAGLH
jgi:hypothetical protein